MNDLNLWVIVALTAIAFCAGLVDSIGGGGGLLTIPALLLAGLAPIDALGTNKVQAVFGSGSAAAAYGRAGKVDLRAMLPLAAVSASGAAVGAVVANVAPADALEMMIPVALIAIAVFFLVHQDAGEDKRGRRISSAVFAATIVPAIGFYDGVLGPGTGSFFAISYVGLVGYSVLEATAHTKVLNFASNLGALVVFTVSGSTLWALGLLMGMSQIVGATTGTRVAVRYGGRIIRPLLVVTCLAMAARLLMN